MVSGTIIGPEGNLVNISSYNKDWDKIPKKYKTRDNFETYCYMRYWGMDAYAAFMEKINQIEKESKCTK